MIKHDWLIESIYNPNLDIYELTTLGELDTSNTQFLNKDAYLKSEIVLDRFTNEKGEFQEQEFNDFYEEQANRWQQLQDNTFAKGLELSIFDTSVRPSSRIKDNKFYLGPDINAYGMPDNPNRVKKGIEGFRTISDRTKTESELAQGSEIYDPETGEFLNVTPNDYALTSNPIKWFTDIVLGEPLVLATYDEDTVDEYGIEHKKGEYKYNKKGTYYYEKLGDRSPIGKQVLSFGDLVTPENSILNSIDFFDSDDMQKSIPGVIAKNVALLAPTFFGSTVAGFYYTAIIAKELTKTLPMLASLYSLVDDNYETPQWMETLAAKGAQSTSNVSYYSRQNVFTLENIANLMSDVALQWGQQRKVSEAVTYFMDTKKDLERAKTLAKAFYDKKATDPRLRKMIAQNADDWESSVLGQSALNKFYKPVQETIRKKQQLGANASLMYMSMISNYDVYNTMLERGATQQEAALVAAASTIGMYGVDKYLGIDKLFFEELTAETARATRKILKNEYDQVISNIYKKGETKKSAKNLFREGFNMGKSVMSKVSQRIKDRDLGILGKALGEGFEEVGEEFVTDISKQLYDFGIYNYALGYDKTIKTAGAWENALERYGMSLLGGFLGGGLYGIRHTNNFNVNQDWDIIDLIRDNRANELRTQVLKDMDAGKLGSTELSGSKHYSLKDGNVSWLSTDDINDSQNHQIAKRVLEKIDALEAFVIGNNANLNDDQLFEHMVLRDARYLSYKNASHVTGYYEEFKNRLKRIAQAENELAKGVKTKSGSPNDTNILSDSEQRGLNAEEQQLRQKRIAQLQANVDQAKKDLDTFLSGDVSLEYTEKLGFALDPKLNSIFLGLDYGKWLLERISSVEELEQDVLKREELQREWTQLYKQKMLNGGLDKAFYAYLSLRKILQNPLQQQQELEQVYRQFHDVVDKMYQEEEEKNLDFSSYFKDKKFYDWNSKLINEEGIEEEDSAFENRNNLSDFDTTKRLYRIRELNNQLWDQYIQQFEQFLVQTGYEVDGTLNRKIQQLLTYRSKDILKQDIMLPYAFEGSVSRTVEKFKHLVMDINPDLSNIEDIKERIINAYNADIASQISKLKQVLASLNKVVVPGEALNATDVDIILKNLNNDNENGSLTSIIKTIESSYEMYKEALEKQNLAAEDMNISDDDYSIISQDVEIAKDILNDDINKLDIKYRTGDSTETSVDNIFTDFLNQPYVSNLTIGDIMTLLQDETSIIYTYFDNYQEGLSKKVLEILKDQNFSFGTDIEAGVLKSDINTISEYENQAISLQKNTLNNYIDFISNLYSQHPLVQFQQKLKTTQKSPLQQLFKIISQQLTEDPQEIVNVNKILDQIYNDYMEESDINKFHLNDTQQKSIELAKKTLDLIDAYIYSISNPTVQGDYFGHTSQINAFAKQHQKELTKEWEQLPEISNDFGLLLQGEIRRMQDEISRWLFISNNNLLNKTARLIRTEEVYNKLKIELIKSLGKVLSIDDKEQYDLSEGLNITGYDLQTLATLEQQFFKNFQQAVIDSGLSYKEFFEKTNFWKTMLSDINIGKIQQQLTSILNEDLKGFTEYDIAIKILELISEDPYDYYQGLINFVKDNESIVPLTVQQVGSRLSQAAHTELYKIGFKSLIKYLDIDDVNAVPEIVHIDGTAGAGKTDVVLRAIRQRFYDQKALVIAPSEKQASKLANVLGEVSYYTIDNSRQDNIFKNLVHNWDIINADFQKLVSAINKRTKEESSKVHKVDTTYFTAISQPTGGGMRGTRIILKNNISFNKDFDQKLVFIDEAAHLNPLQLVLLGKFAELNKGTVYAASDINQAGYANLAMDSLKPSTFFVTKTSRLSESLRSSNIQKQKNGNILDSILDTWNLLVSSQDIKMARQFLQNLPNTLKGLNLSVYKEKDDINGDLLGADIDEVLTVLENHKDQEIGFIGDENSPIYTTLKNKGFKVSTALSEQRMPGRQHMQGDEFDYVIVDKLSNIPSEEDINNNKYQLIEFLYRFNTLSTRSKIATIFMDDFSHILGENKKEEIKSVGFDISESVKLYRTPFLESLLQLKLDKATFGKKVKKETEEAKTTDTGEFTLSGDFKDDTNPELDMSKKQLVDKSKEEKQDILEALDEDNEDTKKDDYTIDISQTSLDLFIEANLTAPNIGLDWTDYQNNGEKRIYRKWMYAIEPKQGEVRRNAAAFVFGNEGQGFSGIKQKHQIESSLSSIQSSIIYGGTPKGDIQKFSNIGNVWAKRKLKIEFREATKQDFFGTGTGLEPTFIDINGKKYVIAVVLQLDGLRLNPESPSFTALFDISFLNDPNTLSKSKVQEEIKKNLRSKLEKGVIAKERTAEVENFINNLSTIAKQWKDLSKTIVEQELVSKKQSQFSIELDSDMYDANKITSLHKIPYQQRLGGRLNLQDVDHSYSIIERDPNTNKLVEKYPEDWNTFLDQDMRKVVSPIYIFGQKSKVLENVIDDSLFGKAVVFVSGNTNLSPDKLANLWLEQKANPDNHTPEVRAIVLNNHGVSFNEFITHRIQDLYPGQGKPHRMDVLGVRMFTALWNFRASLQRFQDALTSWRNKHGYTENSRLQLILAAESELYNTFTEKKSDGIKEDWHNNWENILNNQTEKVNAILNNYTGVTIDDIKNLMLFNLVDCKNIPIFRLGVDFTKKQSGGYVRFFNVENSTVYNKRVAGCIAISLDAITKYNILLNALLEQITTNKSPDIYQEHNIEYKPVGIRVADKNGNDLDTKQFLGDDNRKVANMIRTTGDGIIFGEKGEDGEFIWQYDIKNGEMFSFLPKILSNIATGIKGRQKEQQVGHLSISTVRSVDKKDVKSNVNIDLDGFFEKGGLEYDPSDNSFFHMLHLVFHGTNGHIENHAKTGKSRDPYTEEAPFKYGILVDPELKIIEDWKERNIKGDNNEKWTLLLCGTNPIFFDVNVEVRPGGIRINLNKLIDKYYKKDVGDDQGQLLIDEEDQFKFSDTIQDNDLKAHFMQQVLDGKYPNSQEGLDKFQYDQKWEILGDVFSGNQEFSDEETLNKIKEWINQELKDEVVSTIRYNGNRYIFADEFGQTLDIKKKKNSNKLELSNYQKSKGKKESTSFDVVPQGANMTHTQFIENMKILINGQDQTLLAALENNNFEEYKNFITDTDNKYQLLDYITGETLSEDILEKMNEYLLNIDECK